MRLPLSEKPLSFSAYGQNLLHLALPLKLPYFGLVHSLVLL